MHDGQGSSAGTTTFTAVPARAAVVRRRGHLTTYAISAWDQAKNAAVDVLATVPPPAMGAQLGTVQAVPGLQRYSVILGEAGVKPLAATLECLSKHSRLVLDMSFERNELKSFRLRHA